MNGSGRDRRGVMLAAAALGLVVAAVAMPESALAPVASLFRPQAQGPTPFDDEAAKLDEQLGDATADPAKANALFAEIAVRRLLSTGPMTSEEVARAVVIVAEGERRIRGQEAPEAIQAERDALHARLAKEFPRLDAKRIGPVLDELRAQIDGLRPAPSGAGNGNDSACRGCHSQTRALPDGRAFDVVGVYPRLSKEPEFVGGKRFPVLTESLEVRLETPETGFSSCTDCHSAHEGGTRGLSDEERAVNMGLWVNVFSAADSIIHLQIKVQNQDAAHRAPGGLAKSAYVVTAEVFQGSRRLPFRWGPRLPAHLRTSERVAGMAMARHFVDDRGEVTTDFGRVADLKSDTRLQSGQFIGRHFVFDRVSTEQPRLVVTLWYLPDYSTWKGAKVIRRSEKPATLR